jgi:hypothetical protein
MSKTYTQIDILNNKMFIDKDKNSYYFFIHFLCILT